MNNEHFAPSAVAYVKGSDSYPDISGAVWFYRHTHGTAVAADISGLPHSIEQCKKPIFAFHIHEGNACTESTQDPFASTGGHYNPHGCMHPYHAGDMPPLFSANGYAFSSFITDRFCVNEVIGKTVIIHSMPDDFTTQPSGNAGTKIACGVIQRI